MKSLSARIPRVEESLPVPLIKRAQEMRSAGIDVVNLTVGDPDFPTPPHIKVAAIQAIDEDFTHYTPVEGIPALIDAIIEKFNRDNNLHFDRAQVLVSTGSKQSLYNTLLALCNPEDEVIIPAPHWVRYVPMVKLAGARPVVVATSADDGFKMSAKQLRKTINARTKALMFNSPCNPTGAVYSQGEIEELADVVRETGIYVISDEIYEKIVFDTAKHFSMGSIKQIRDQVITVNGVSKAFAMTGWRIGYLGGPEEIVRAAAKVQKQTTSGANSIAQRAVVAALSGPQGEVEAMRAELQRRRDFVDEEFSKIPGLEFVKPQGAIYCFPSVGAFIGKRVSGTLMRSCEDVCRFLLEEEHVAILPGTLLGDKDRARITFAVAWKDLQKGMERLKSGFKKLAEAP